MNPQIMNQFDQIIQVLGWCLVHSIWIGAVLASVLKVILKGVASQHSRARYLSACVCLLLTLIASVWFGVSQPIHTGISTSGFSGSASQSDVTAIPKDGNVSLATQLSEPIPAIDAPGAGLSQTVASAVSTAIPWLVLVWSLGLLIVGLRTYLGWFQLHKLCRVGVQAPDPNWLNIFERVRSNMSISRRVRWLYSDKVGSPMVVGWVKPTVLLPLACMSGLNTKQVEALIAHELVHVARHDYLYNLIQCLIEVALFYHPAVWWISRQIRHERERCCDDRVLRAGSDRDTYARALVKAAELAGVPAGRLSTASTHGDLNRRVRRILDVSEPRSTSRLSIGIGSITIAACLLSILGAVVQADRATASDNQATPLSADAPDTESTESAVIRREIEVPYNALIRGDESYNIVVRPGDVVKAVTQAEGGFVYLGGVVGRPGAYNFPGGQSLTLKQLIASAGGYKENAEQPLYVQIIRRVDGQEITAHSCSLDDLFGGWAPDSYLAPNDLVAISQNPPSDETDAQRQRQNLRKNKTELLQNRTRLRDRYNAVILESGNDHDTAKRLDIELREVDQKINQIHQLLVPDNDQAVRQILEAPMPPAGGEPPLPRDLVVTPLPNTAKPGDSLTVTAIPRNGGSDMTRFVRTLSKTGTLALPGTAAVPFVNRPIGELEAELLEQLKQVDGFEETQRISIALTSSWYFSPQEQDTKAGPLVAIPQADFRLADAVTMMQSRGLIPDKTTAIKVIREEAVAP